MKKLNCILLVDDDDTTNFYNEFLIKKMGIAENIRVARNGLEALEYLRKTGDGDGASFLKPQLIFLDINMPLMDGFQFLEEYQKLDSSSQGDMLIVMLTSSSHPMDVERASTSTVVTDYVTKPLMEDTIQKILEVNFN